MTNSPIGRYLFLLLCGVSLFMAPLAQAREMLLLTGAEGGGGGGTTNYYTFLGAVAPIAAQSLGHGPVQKYWVDFLGYDYPAGERDITATAIGVEGALGYQKGGEGWWGGVYGGLRYSHTWLSPDHSESRVRGHQLRPHVQIEGEKHLSRDWKVNAIGRYLFISDAYWARGRVMYRPHGEIDTGPEFIAHGDPDYKAWQGGWAVTFPLSGGSAGVKGGIRKIEKADQGVYVGLEWARLF